MNRKKLLQKLSRGPYRNVAFQDMIKLAQGFGFVKTRQSGSNHILIHPDIPELLNFQDVNGEAKPYQIRQFLKLVERHNLRLGDEE